MFAYKFSKPFGILYLWCAIGFWTWTPELQSKLFVDATPITTKSSPSVILDNGGSNSSQFVQIRSTVNQQPNRPFLVQPKNSLSPVQQTHILDDVQKNQRVHYQPPYNGGTAQATSPLRNVNGFPTGHQNAFEPAATLDDYGNFNSLSAPPPPLQTLVLSPEQTLPTSPSFTNEYFSPPSHTYRQPSAGAAVDPSPSSLGVSSSSSSSHRIPFSTAGAAATAVGRPSAAGSENFHIKNNAVNAAIQNYPPPIRYISGNLTGTGSANDQYPKYEPTLPGSYLPTASKTKPYHLAKDATNSLASHSYPHPHSQLLPQPQPQPQPPNFVEKPKYVNNRDAGVTANAAPAPTSETAPAINSDKFIKEVYLKMNPEILIAKDRQKFFQQLLEGDTRSPNRNPAGYRDDDIFALASSGNDDNEDGDADNEDADGDQTVAQNNLGNVRNQFEKELLRQLKQASGVGSTSQAGLGLASSIVNGSANAGSVAEFRLPNGQKVQISKDYNRLLLDDSENSDTSILGGNSASNKIKAIVVKQLTSTTSAPKTNLLEELTKGVVPAGAEFEVIKRNKDGALEEVSKLPQNIPQKKVTFVILEEQPDGTVRVQGVRGSEKESLKESGEEVDTIIKKIKEGELKLPPSTRLSPKQSPSPSLKKHFRHGDDYETKSKRKSTAVIGNGETPPYKRREQQSSIGSSLDKHFIPTPVVQAYTTPESLNTDPYEGAATTPDDSSYQYYSSPSTFYTNDDKYSATATAATTPSNGDGAVAAATILNQLASAGGAGDSWNRAILNSPLSDASAAKIAALDNFGLFHLNNSGYIASLFSALKSQAHSQPSLLPTTLGHRNVRPSNERVNSTLDDDTYTYEPSSAVSSTAEAAFANISGSSSSGKKDNFYKKRDRNAIRKSVKKPPIKETRKDNDEEESNLQETKSEDAATNENSTLSDVLKKEGFYAMARFLRQSGLDSILNDTGPFTLFIPTDKAFRTLLIQLGGPDKAEEKFKENPRLLSGLLLHHVIPGAFRVNTLQDEMTGVSLAGTQLRVNTYTTHDIEWNDITVVTVNGAKILDEKDIVIPQGIAHAIDRVMFPLPVGNLLQSLQADRENRYSNFLKILEESELSHLLTAGKTFTLFAPLNRAFTHAEFTKILADANESKSFVLRHLVPGALYSAGMKYYQVRDSMEDGQQITLYKEAGKIKVNNAHVVTRNIPATNGVIHAIDAFL